MNDRNAMVVLANLALSRGLMNLNEQPGVCELRIDETWTAWINAHPEPTKTEGGMEVPPYCAYVEFLGWPAGLVSARQVSFLAASDAANIETFMDAVEAATR